MNWKDATTYSRYDVERKQDAWELSTGQLRIWISTGHIYHKGEWVITCHELRIDAISLRLPADATPEQAQERAIALARRRLQNMLDSLEQIQ